ncbi:hypothetical protein HNR29_002267 [Rhizobium leguminosarum]|nr:hypothetical protein [Rhizobium leguminosarum]
MQTLQLDDRFLVSNNECYWTLGKLGAHRTELNLTVISFTSDQEIEPLIATSTSLTAIVNELTGARVVESPALSNSKLLLKRKPLLNCHV